MSRCTVSGNEPVNAPDAPVPNSATRADGQHVDHWTMCPTEVMQAGFNRPVRMSYVHVGPPGPEFPLRDLTAEESARFDDEDPFAKFEPYPAGHRGSAIGRYWTQAEIDAVDKGCGVETSMPRAIAETYAATPGYYGSTFCCGCGKYLPVGVRGEFVWTGTAERVGT